MAKPYVSEFTIFIDRLLAEHPEIERNQRIGRAMYWDRAVDPSREQRMAVAAVAKKWPRSW